MEMLKNVETGRDPSGQTWGDIVLAGADRIVGHGYDAQHMTKRLTNDEIWESVWSPKFLLQLHMDERLMLCLMKFLMKPHVLWTSEDVNQKYQHHL